MISVTASIISQNTFTSTIAPVDNFHSEKAGHLTGSISGTWVGTVHVQRSFDNGYNWLSVNTYSANAEFFINDVTDGIIYRIGIPTGSFTSGTCVVLLAK
jgi:hypothetical protein